MDALNYIKEEVIDCIVFSPPYWGLRDYGLEATTVWGGDNGCDHLFTMKGAPPRKRNPSDVKDQSSIEASRRGEASTWDSDKIVSNFCNKCNAWKGQLGMEPHPQMFIDHMTDICMKMYPLLKKTGSMYINIGDTYYTRSGTPGYGWDRPSRKEMAKLHQYQSTMKSNRSNWLQPKQKLLIPHRLAISLQNNGWIVRNDIVWHKLNSMPSSVKDRRSNTFEYIFHFVKKRKYYYDLDSIRIPHITSKKNTKSSVKTTKHDLAVNRVGNLSYTDSLHKKAYNPKGKNPGDIITKRVYANIEHFTKKGSGGHYAYGGLDSQNGSHNHPLGKNPGDILKINTQPFTGAHFAVFPPKLIEPLIKSSCPEGGIVLDPFLGSGTTMMVARNLCRQCIGIEINPEYVEIAKKRVFGPQKLDAECIYTVKKI